jgi:hypothetical protein
MPISTLVGFLQAVERQLHAWTSTSLSALPNFPVRPDIEEWAKTAWFRGHSESRWKLLPSVYRLSGYTAQREVDMNRSFQMKATFLSDLPSQQDLPAWLSLMQHHGLPTRLLDWSESSTIALYFAIETYRDYLRWERKRWFRPVVWMLNPHALNWIGTNGSGSIVPSTDLYERAGNDKDGWTIAWGCANVFPAFGASHPQGMNYQGPMAVKPHVIDRRMHAQRSRFTVHGSRPDPMEDMFRGDAANDLIGLGFLHEIRIDPAAAGGLLQQLAAIGITRSTLFPDLEGIAAESVAAITGAAGRDLPVSE